MFKLYQEQHFNFPPMSVGEPYVCRNVNTYYTHVLPLQLNPELRHELEAKDLELAPFTGMSPCLLER